MNIYRLFCSCYCNCLWSTSICLIVFWSIFCSITMIIDYIHVCIHTFYLILVHYTLGIEALNGKHYEEGLKEVCLYIVVMYTNMYIYILIHTLCMIVCLLYELHNFIHSLMFVYMLKYRLNPIQNINLFWRQLWKKTILLNQRKVPLKIIRKEHVY